MTLHLLPAHHVYVIFHDILHFGYLGLDPSQLVHLLWMVHHILHVLLQLRTARKGYGMSLHTSVLSLHECVYMEYVEYVAGRSKQGSRSGVPNFEHSFDTSSESIKFVADF